MSSSSTQPKSPNSGSAASPTVENDKSEHGEDIVETPGDASGDEKEDESTEKDAAEPRTSSSETPAQNATNSSSAGGWQAIWSPAHNAYYFYNTQTAETTWVNPLQSATEASTSAASQSTATPDTSSNPVPLNPNPTLQEAAIAQGIDPDLAFLDPTLLSNPAAMVGGFKAKFNARTGAFTALDARDPSHMSEAERAKRMSSVYFDIGAWEKELEQRYAQEKEDEEAGTGKKRKRPTKADLERFKQQKKARKIAKTAWLRE